MSTGTNFTSIHEPRWVDRTTARSTTQFVPALNPEIRVPAPLRVMVLEYNGTDASSTDGVVMFELWETRPPS